MFFATCLNLSENPEGVGLVCPLAMLPGKLQCAQAGRSGGVNMAGDEKSFAEVGEPQRVARDEPPGFGHLDALLENWDALVGPVRERESIAEVERHERETHRAVGKRACRQGALELTQCMAEISLA